ncbi:MAG: outer membrane beta-barrel protein [Cyclobacteriaceae bacterium]
MEREKFEESLKNAFDKAEISPSDKVWMNIELDLEKAKGGHLKRRLMFYQMLAAASVVFAMAIGGVGFYNIFNQDQRSADNAAVNTPATSDGLTSASDKTTQGNDLAIQEERNSTSRTEGTASPAITPDNTASGNEVQGISGQGNSLPRDHSQTPGKNSDASNFSDNPQKDGLESFADTKPGDRFTELPRAIDDRALSPLYSPKEIKVIIQPQKQEEPVVDPVLQMLARLEQREREVQDEKENKKKGKNQNENLWTSVGFAAGSFNTVQSVASSPAPATLYSNMSLAAPIVDQETKASGYTYSMGVNVGTKISERWVFQGGVNYLTHASEYTANNVVAATNNFQQQRFRAVSTNDLMHSDEADLNNKIVYSAPYNVNNSMRYLSIPMQAGYLLVNKTFGLQLNAGVATDLFLQNTIKADSDQLDKTSQPGGADSPYRSVNLSGLLGTEVSYRFGHHYRVSLNPGIRYPFNTIYKSELGVQSTPLTFDVGLRFRYIFH